MTDTRKWSDSLIFALSVTGFVLFWWALSVARGDPRILPPPDAVLSVIWAEAQAGRLWQHMSATLVRVVFAFGFSMILGSVLGMALGRFSGLNRWLDPWVMIFLNLPALVVIVLCYLWIGLNEGAAIAAVTINKTAMVLVTMREGTRTLRSELAEMAAVFRLSALSRLRHIVLPQLAPFFATSARLGLAIIWKIVLVVEFLGRSSGIGFQIHMKFQMFEIDAVLAYALSFVLVMLAVDALAIKPLERRANRWRPGRNSKG